MRECRRILFPFGCPFTPSIAPSVAPYPFDYPFGCPLPLFIALFSFDCPFGCPSAPWIALSVAPSSLWVPLSPSDCPFWSPLRPLSLPLPPLSTLPCSHYILPRLQMVPFYYSSKSWTEATAIGSILSRKILQGDLNASLGRLRRFGSKNSAITRKSCKREE